MTRHVVTHEGLNTHGRYWRIDPVSRNSISKSQPSYSKWLAEHFIMGCERCQSPWCSGLAEQRHHEPCGAYKTDASEVAICAKCHRDRTNENPPDGWTMEQVKLAYEGIAFRNWRRWREKP